MESAAPYAPVLPDADPNPAIRRASIEQGQSKYQIAHAYDGFDGVAVAASVPAEFELLHSNNQPAELS
jgi:hypothetical protein